ncbi:SAVMC3_10250 family protein [Streptomyces chartreusis]|uniref:SAVMC3_10250 family protein n=1 Tax=Streptomyces chartreusis TaxID=1969 RepID=UPI00363050AC
MRELVYLSERKLQQFRLGKRRRWGSVEGEINFFGFGTIRFGPTTPGGGDGVTPDLESVISALEASDRAALWFEDPAVQPGQWVYFEAPLYYAPLGMGDETVVFVDHRESATSYPDGGKLRLLMHGSMAHVLGSATSPPVTPPQYPDDRSPALEFNLCSHFGTFSHLLAGLIDRLAAADDGDTDAAARAAAGLTAPLPTMTWLWRRGVDDVVRHVQYTVHDLDSYAEPLLTASWMAGYARVTAKVPPWYRDDPTVVVATPLYVERISAPSGER